MRPVVRLLILVAITVLPACTCSPVINELKFACTTSADCAEGFSCGGGECRTTSGGGGGCDAGTNKSCAISGCTQACGADGGFQQCAPVTGGPFASNPDHCGECGRACAKGSGMSCVNSHCTCQNDTDCPAGDLCAAGGICVNAGDACATVRCPPGEVCRAGSCGAVTCAEGCGTIEVCDALSSRCRPVETCRFPITCDGGICDGDPRPDGIACNDSVVCSHTDVCAAGACTGTAYSCSTSNPCRQAGACLGDGGCDGVAMADGTPCDDGAACTFADQCAAGMCSGTSYVCNPTQCAASSSCAGDGGCLVSPRNVGAACDDNDLCSIGDVCGDAGFCKGTIYSCPLPTACQQSVACAGDGGCIVADKPNGASCDDGKACTANDLCTNNVCDGVVSTTYRDNDGDGRGDSNITASTCPEPAGYVALGGDCDDNDLDVYQFLMVATDADQDGVTASTTLTGTCVGATSTIGGRTYYKDLNGVFSFLAVASAVADCNDGDLDVFQTLAVARDLDQDGVTLLTTPSSQCVGTTSLVAGRTYYSDSAGAFTWLAAASAAADCLDSDPDVFQNVSVIEDVDQDGYGASASSVASRCVGNTSLAGGRTYYRSLTGGYSWLLGAQNLGSDCNDASAVVQGPANYYPDLDGDGFGAGTAVVACAPPAQSSLDNTDCNDGSGFVYVNRLLFDDGDQDGFTEGAAANQCSGVSSTVNGRTYYRAASGAYTWIAASLGADCDDALATVTAPVDWYADVDGDTYGTGVASSACTAPVGKPVRNNTDCNDGNGNVFINRFVFPDTDLDGYTDGAQATQCTGGSGLSSGRTYYRSTSGALAWITTSLGADCNASSGALFATVNNVVADDDRDGYPPNDTQVDVCAGATSFVGGRTYYAASAAANDYWLQKTDCIYYQNQAGGHCLAPFDCYDLNSSANPVQISYFTSSRGDGSFDYNCSGAATSNTALTTYCVSAGASTFYPDGTCSTGAFTATRCGSTPAVSLPAACGQFNAISGPNYFDGVGCPAASRQGTTQIGCR